MTARAALWGLCTWKKKQHFHQFYILTCIHFVSDDSSWPWLHLRGRGDTVGEVSVTIKQWMPADSDGLWSDTGQFESHKFLWKKKKKNQICHFTPCSMRESFSLNIQVVVGGRPPSVTENCLYDLQLVCLILLNHFLHQATFLRGPEWHQMCHFLNLS